MHLRGWVSMDCPYHRDWDHRTREREMESTTHYQLFRNALPFIFLPYHVIPRGTSYKKGPSKV